MDIGIELIAQLRDSVREKQNFHRYEHTLGVAYTAACMAFVHGEDILKAELAGVLHDCAKCYKNEELIRLCAEEGVALTPEELASPAVIHAKYGRRMAEKEYGIDDPDILNAIAYHTTGRPDMSRLEKIVFIADFIEPLRDQAENLPEARKLAFEDLDLCVYNILESTIRYLERRNSPIVPDTVRAYEWYRDRRLCK